MVQYINEVHRMSNIIWTFDNLDFEKKVIGPLNQSLSIINLELDINLTHIPNHLLIDNDEMTDLVLTLLNILNRLFNEKVNWHDKELIHIISSIKHATSLADVEEEIVNFYHHKTLILNTQEGKKIYAKTLMQKQYLNLLETSSILFVTGSAGTGKTYLAVAYAVASLKKNEIKKIIITRPAVEAGEKLGFLPGDLKEKVDPYLIPIYDALNEFLGKENVDKLVEKGVIEIAPLAYMRGRTLDHAIIILDEAQNTTSNQMKMFVTRLGFNSKMIITGDLSQIDLQKGISSGLLEATKLLTNITGINHLHFTKHDVMRHPLVSKIIERYEKESNDTL